MQIELVDDDDTASLEALYARIRQVQPCEEPTIDIVATTIPHEHVRQTTAVPLADECQAASSLPIVEPNRRNDRTGSIHRPSQPPGKRGSGHKLNIKGPEVEESNDDDEGPAVDPVISARLSELQDGLAAFRTIRDDPSN